MKKITLLCLTIFCLCMHTALMAQQQKKAQPMPSQAEIDNAMKLAQDAMNNLPPEAKKMMDSMGLKMPDMKKLPNQQQIAGMQSKYQNLQVQNKKNIQTVIAGLPKKTLSQAALEIFIQQSFTKIDKGTSAKAKEQALRIIAESKAKHVSVQNSAILALMAKGGQQALWILAKLATENTNDANLLCNYSAVATMCGGAHLAIPVLNYLNNKFPKNSSILGNLGEAWYSLDKTDSAEKYLRLALNIYPRHAIANHTMAAISEAKGNTTDQVKYLKEAIKNGYTEKTEAALKKAGIKLSKNDIKWPFSTPNDPAGLDKLDIPEFPMNTKASDDLEPKWKAFKSVCKAESEKYGAEAKKLGEEVMEEQKQLMAKVMQTKNASVFEAPFAKQAGIYFKEDAELAFKKSVQSISDLAQAKIDIAALHEQESKRGAEIDAAMEKKYKGRCPGEGCPYDQYCPDFAKETNASSDTYLKAANTLWSSAVAAEIDALKTSLGISLNIAIYTSVSDKKLQWEIATAKAAYMTGLGDIECEFRTTVPDDCGNTKLKPGKVKLSDFDEFTCPSENKLYLGFGVGKIAITCTKFSIEGGEFLQGSFEKDLKTGEFEIGIGVGVAEHLGGGPLSAEASAKVMEIFHFDETGKYTDMGVKVSAGMAANIGALNAEAEGSMTAMIHGGGSAGMEASAGVKFLQ